MILNSGIHHNHQKICPILWVWVSLGCIKLYTVTPKLFHLYFYHIRLIHCLQTLASLKSWVLLRAVFQLWNKMQSLSEELPEESEPAMKFPAAALHLVISSRICWLPRSCCDELPVRGVPQPSIFSSQLVRV